MLIPKRHKSCNVSPVVIIREEKTYYVEINESSVVSVFLKNGGITNIQSRKYN